MPATRKIIVSTTPIQLVPENPKRTVLAIANVGNYVCYVSVDPANITSQGFPVGPGTYVAWKKVDGDHPELMLFAQATADTEIRLWEDWSD